MEDEFGLERFVLAQAPVRAQVEAELRAGRKASHWMWFVFPQLAGLGRSAMALHYGIASRAEAEAYLAHGSLGPWLLQCCGLVMEVQGRSALQVFGSPDDMKLRSCVTLFDAVRPGAVFAAVLARYYGGASDPATLRLLGGD